MNKSKAVDILDNLKEKYSFWRLHNVSDISWKIVRFIILVSLSYILLYPLILMHSYSLRIYQEVYDPSVVWIPKTFTLDNFVAALNAMKVVESGWMSIKLSVFTSIIQLVACAITGYGFARFKFKGKGIMMAIVIFTIIVPPSTYIIPQYLDFRQFNFLGIGWIYEMFTGKPLNILNTIWTFYIPAFFANGLRSGLFIFIFIQFFRGLPVELEDAAHIDGAGFLKTFFRVMIPVSIPAFVTVFLFSMVWYWNETTQVSMFFSLKKTLPYALEFLANTLDSVYYDDYGNINLRAVRMQAGAFISIAPMLIVYIVMQRYFTESIDRIGIKG